VFGRWLGGLVMRNVSVRTVVGWFNDEKRECSDGGWVV